MVSRAMTLRSRTAVGLKRRTVKVAVLMTAMSRADSLATPEKPSRRGIPRRSSRRQQKIPPAALPSVVTPEKVIKKAKHASSAAVGKPRRPSSSAKVTKKGKRTCSFGAVTGSSLGILDCCEPHTLILGTHPSVASLHKSQYYGHPMNAFWWIAGDCLGFRRDTAVSSSSGKPYKFAKDLRHEAIVPYEEQLRIFVSKGFALWDIVQSCERPGSLDQDIRKEKPNEIRQFCQQFPSIRRIVIANGGTGSTIFVRHFGEWLMSGELVAADEEGSIEAFGKVIGETSSSANAIELVSAWSVSPASARKTYREKRDFWESYVYKPGLQDFESMHMN